MTYGAYLGSISHNLYTIWSNKRFSARVFRGEQIRFPGWMDRDADEYLRKIKTLQEMEAETKRKELEDDGSREEGG